MKIYDLPFEPIERVEGATSAQARELMLGARRPLIFGGLQRDFRFLERWDLDFLAGLGSDVPVQTPEPDGVNYFYQYAPMPIAEFVDRVRAGENLYIGAREILSPRGEPSTKDGLAKLADSLELPSWVDRERLWSANLWVGAGDNRTLIHYDPWNSIQILREGSKTFYVFRDSDSPKLYPYSALNFRSLYLGKVLHSRIRPLSVQPQYQARFSTLSGLRGEMRGGDVIFIPAGFWHYVESSGQNVGVNFFVGVRDRSLHGKEPLRTYWIKDNVTLWPIRWLYHLKFKFFRVLRRVLPRR